MSASPAIPNAPGEQEGKRRPWSAYLRVLRRVRQRLPASTDAGAMTILQHLEELRLRILKAGIALTITTAVSFLFAARWVEFLTTPIGGRAALASIEITENIGMYMRVAVMGGLVLGMPFVLYHIVAYLSPGLHPRERRWLYTLIPAVMLFFAAGAAFAWFIMIPVALPFLINFLGIPTHPRPLNYINFVGALLLWVGLSFEMPLVVFFLAKLKWVTAGQLVRGWRYAVMGIATLAAVVTPTVDPVNMGLVMLPLLALYLISIVLAWVA